jgi:hypothetical protein
LYNRIRGGKGSSCIEKRPYQGVPYLSLAYITHIKVVTEEARKYFAGEANEELLKLAFITNSGFSKIVGNIFLTIDRPKRLQGYLQIKKKHLYG